MSLNANYVIDRATATHACAVVIRDDPTDPFEWSEMTVDDYKDKLDAAHVLMEDESAEATDTTAARGLRDADLEALRGKMRSYLGLAKRKYRHDPAKMRLLTPLVVKSNGVRRTLKLALDVESAWKKLDQTYVPETGNTFAAFGTLRAACELKYEAVAKEGAEEGQAGGELAKALKELHRLSVDWYQEAFRRFGPETAHGMMIRDEIPTLEGALPAQAVITSIIYENNGATIGYDALHATTFDVWMRTTPGAAFDKVASGITAKTFTMGDTHGDFDFKVVGINSRGPGPESDVASISG